MFKFKIFKELYERSNEQLFSKSVLYKAYKQQKVIKNTLLRWTLPGSEKFYH